MAKRKDVTSDVKRSIDAYYRAYVLRFNPLPWKDSGLSYGQVWMQDVEANVAEDQRRIPRDQMILPKIEAKHGAQIKKLIQSYGAGPVFEMCQTFVGLPDRRVLSSDYSIGSLYRLADYLRTRNARPADPAEAGRVEAFMKATGRS